MTTSRQRTSPGPRGLSKDIIVEAALELMEAGGEAGFTLRKLGTRVGCDPMSILYHFKSKEGLYRAMAGRLESQLRIAPAALPWRGRMRHLADQYRSVALRFPKSFWLMQNFVYTGPADYDHMEMVHGALREAGIPTRDIPAICLGWYACITGLAMGEIGGLVGPASTQDLEELAQLPDHSHPLLKGAMPLYQDLAPNSVFALSIEMLLDGIVALAAQHETVRA
ncbi:TetR/AcrR family transcriptional regulator [Mycoplana dimorpha]|uniref:TetR/AcrR family transcriptional regulator n=1 Tax=Mycoplana dimorpha TaxID=28320 RepID=UPI000D3D340B|nr:TetR/AcrR family transcriptional regulator [Mycoplana dimorpha]